jgi:spore maturation protein CgeB
VIGGSQYPADFPWSANINYVWHVPPPMHPAFYCSARLNLNITRAPMAALGYCPSGRLFEAAACGAALISDTWDGLSDFYAPGEELIAVRSSDDVLDALALSEHEVRRIAARARERTLAEHTTTRRADQLLELLQDQRACERKDSLSLEI